MLIRRLSKGPTDPKQRRRLVWKRFFLGVVVLLVGVAAWVGITGALALKNITAKNTNETPAFFKYGNNITPDQLLTEGDARINILLLGVDSAAGLTDSIQIASIDPINHSVAMLSVPRDLYVTNPAKKRKTRINEVYRDSSKSCTKKTTTCDPAIDYGAQALEDLLSDLLGVKVSYFSKVDFDGLKKLVDSLGGIQVYVEKSLSDPAFPNRNYSGFDPFFVKAGLQTMNGELALKYARCRGGNCGGDFGRAKRQQQVVMAIREKATSLNIITNPQKLTSMINAAGKGFKTDLSIDQIVQLYKLIKDVQTATIVSAVLDNSAEGVLKNVTIGGAYLLIPKLGENDWSGVKDFVSATFPEPYLVKEKATVAIINASGKASLATTVSAKLKQLGYNVTLTETAETTQTATTITYIDDKSPYTISLLKKRFSVTPKKVKADATITTQIVITLGSSYK
jgi:LCP family protein required for cell wall assembly